MVVKTGLVVGTDVGESTLLTQLGNLISLNSDR